MYLAELHGKIPSSLEDKEDILTSNVFSFLKYSDRRVYLREFLKLLALEVSDDDLDGAEFQFWLNYDDKTQPDLIIVVGNYYLLIEAKHLSDFNVGGGKKAQLLREIEGGMNEAKSLGKEFYLIAVTSDYVYQSAKFKDVISLYPRHLKWINWHSISIMLLNLLEKYDSSLPNFLFTTDLYHLLAKKKLRSFRSFENLLGTGKVESFHTIFFAVDSARFRGQFIGFSESLSGLPEVIKPKGSIFYSRIYFNGLQFRFDVNQYDLYRKRGK
ncbi:MAG TPA: hypothetical protein PK250_07585 [Syntrophobacter fumaroxidans]|nr:hypothetical protein [Syntrophobacter fumaroxidans]